MNRSTVRRALRFAGVTGAALVATLATALPAHAINRVDCGNRLDFLYFQSDGGRPCFANAGTVDVAIYGVDRMHTGNNEVSIKYRAALGGPLQETGRIPKWTDINIGALLSAPNYKLHKIEQITIY